MRVVIETRTGFLVTHGQSVEACIKNRCTAEEVRQSVNVYRLDGNDQYVLGSYNELGLEEHQVGKYDVPLFARRKLAE